MLAHFLGGFSDSSCQFQVLNLIMNVALHQNSFWLTKKITLCTDLAQQPGPKTIQGLLIIIYTGPVEQDQTPQQFAYEDKGQVAENEQRWLLWIPELKTEGQRSRYSKKSTSEETKNILLSNTREQNYRCQVIQGINIRLFPSEVRQDLLSHTKCCTECLWAAGEYIPKLPKENYQNPLQIWKELVFVQ